MSLALLSLALFEPASVPGELSAEEAGFAGRLQEAVVGLNGPEFLRAFVRARCGMASRCSTPPGRSPFGCGTVRRVSRR